MPANLRADKYNDQQITSTVKRMVPGSYDHFTDATHPALDELGLFFSAAGSSPPQKVLGDIMADTLSTRPQWVKDALAAEGEWVFVKDQQLASSSPDALWMIQASDNPSTLFKDLERFGIHTDAVIITRQVKGTWLVVIQASFLKDILKKSTHSTY